MRNTRRRWLGYGLLLALVTGGPLGHLHAAEPPIGRLLFNCGGATGVIHADGTKLHWLSFAVPNQATWQVGGFFSTGHLLLLSMEPRRDGPGRPFDEYYTQTPTHLWRYDLETQQLEELATHDRMAPFYTPALVLSDHELLVQVVKEQVGQIFRMRIDGTEARPLTQPDEGLPYGLSVSPRGDRLAFHLASPQGYQVWTSDLNGEQRIKIAAADGHLYFGTSWSPDGQWIVYHDCHAQQDPGHDWSDVCVGRADGSEHRVLTTGQVQWFAATYGPPHARGGGSNLPAWTHDGQILFSRRLPDSKVPWEYQAGRPDVDHFNREYRPAAAQGGTVISRLNPQDGSHIALTSSQPPVWDFRATPSPDGQWIAFCRAATGEVPSLWLMRADGSEPRLLATGRDGQGIDHPRWIP